jgi:hypothetical protein
LPVKKSLPYYFPDFSKNTKNFHFTFRDVNPPPKNFGKNFRQTIESHLRKSIIVFYNWGYRGGDTGGGGLGGGTSLWSEGNIRI